MAQNINGVSSTVSSCCYETNRNIDNVKFENAQNTCAITTAIHEEGEKTRALITAFLCYNVNGTWARFWLKSFKKYTLWDCNKHML